MLSLETGEDMRLTLGCGLLCTYGLLFTIMGYLKEENASFYQSMVDSKVIDFINALWYYKIVSQTFDDFPMVFLEFSHKRLSLKANYTNYSW